MNQNEPLLLRFAKPIPELASQITRYNPAKQVTEVNLDGNWVKGWRSSDPLLRGTKTAVHNEPTE